MSGVFRQCRTSPTPDELVELDEPDELDARARAHGAEFAADEEHDDR
jgi:hypothetical protein